MKTIIFATDESEVFEKYDFFTTSLFRSISKKANEDRYTFEIDFRIAYCLLQKINYTKINYKKLQLCKSKYSQKLYEYIEWYMGINYKSFRPAKINIKKEEFQKIFEVSKPEALSTTLQKINQSNALVNDLRSLYGIHLELTPKRTHLEIQIDEKGRPR